MRRLVTAIVLGAMGAIACSSSDASNGSSDGGGSAGAGASAGASGTAGASETDGGAGAAGASAPKAGFVGVVSAASATSNVFTNAVSADFFDGPGYGAPKGCQRQTSGGCWVLSCDLTNGGDQMPPTGAAQSAGTITIGGTSPAFSLAYDAGTQKYAPTPAVPGFQLLFAGGDTITIAAAGADVAAFSDSLVAPTPVVVTSPAITGGALPVDTTADLVFQWTGTSAGALSFNVRSATTSGGAAVASVLVSCAFDPSAGTGTMPAALLSALHKTDASTTATLSTDLSNAKEVSVGDHRVHLAVGSAATLPDGKTPYGATQVTLQ